LGDISVEGELGTVSGVEDQIKVAEDEAALCDPETAVSFVEETGIDILAPAIGTAHGIYKTANPKSIKQPIPNWILIVLKRFLIFLIPKSRGSLWLFTAEPV